MSTVIDIIDMIVGIAGLILAGFVAFALDRHFDFRHAIKESTAKECGIGFSDVQYYATVPEGKSGIAPVTSDKDKLTTRLHLEKENNGNKVGIAFNDLQYNSWIGLIRKNCHLHFKCTLDDSYKGKMEIQFEFENSRHEKIFSKICTLASGENGEDITLQGLIYNTDRWRDIAKVCLVFQPESVTAPYDGEVIIEKIRVEK